MRLYPTADGWIYVECHNERERAALARVLDLPAVVDWPLGWSAWCDVPGDEARAAMLAAVFARVGAAEWEPRLQAAGVPAVRADGIDHLEFKL